MVLVAGKDFVDPELLLRDMLGERMRAVEEQFPEPRSRADEERIEKERRLVRELRVARRTACGPFRRASLTPQKPHAQGCRSRTLRGMLVLEPDFVIGVAGSGCVSSCGE